MKWFLRFLLVLEKIIFWPTRTVMVVPIFLHHLRKGLYYSYPLCCTMNFAIGWALGVRKQGVRRGGIRVHEDKHYVPCIFHKRRHPLWYPHSREPRLRPMARLTRGHRFMANFYQSVKAEDWRLAALMHENLVEVLTYSLSWKNFERGQKAADHLRKQATVCPVGLRQVLENALEDLGYL